MLIQNAGVLTEYILYNPGIKKELTGDESRLENAHYPQLLFNNLLTTMAK